MSDKLIHIPDHHSIPWHEFNIRGHLSRSEEKKETTLTLYTKDHKKVIIITDNDYLSIASYNERQNWAIYRKEEWQREIKALYKSIGD